MTAEPAILVVGTWDTKAEELAFLADRIAAAGGRPVRMDVSVLGDPPGAVDIDKHAVAAAGGSSIAEAAASEDENRAMQVMARGAAALAAALHRTGRIRGMVALGGTMGTDLALDVASALPPGVPKLIVSTVAFSPLIPPGRLAPDMTMMLWAGGLYGLNTLCRATLAQAAGAVTGAARAAAPAAAGRPVIGMTSLGASCLGYMTRLKGPLEARGFEVAVFHTTGMGGMAFEVLARAGAFACVMDFSLQELANELAGSAVTAGPGRLTGAGAAGVPQIVAPGATDMVDFPAHQPVPAALAGRPFHAHNRLIASAMTTADERRACARAIAGRLAGARGPVHLILPAGGVEGWDRPGGPMHDPEGLAAFCEALRAAVRPPVALTDLPAHVNDAAFAEAALAVLDGWIAAGVVRAR